MKFVGSKLEAAGEDICARITLKLVYMMLWNSHIYSFEPLSLRVFRLHSLASPLQKELGHFGLVLMSQITTRPLLFSFNSLVTSRFFLSLSNGVFRNAIHVLIVETLQIAPSWNWSYKIKRCCNLQLLELAFQLLYIKKMAGTSLDSCAVIGWFGVVGDTGWAICISLTKSEYCHITQELVSFIDEECA